MEQFGSEINMIGPRIICDSSASTTRRLVWLLLLLGGIVVLVYQVQDRVNYYLSYPTSISSSHSYRDSIDFPKVTICNVNPVRLGWFKEQFGSRHAWNKSREYLSYYQSVNHAANHHVKSMAETGEDSNVVGNVQELQFIPHDQVRNSAHKMNATDDKSGIIVQANWQNVKLEQLTKAFKPELTDLGSCIVFNIGYGDKFTVDQADIKDGLILLLNVAVEEYVNLKLGYSVDGTTGFRVSIGDGREWADSENGMLFGPGFAYDVKLSLSEQYKLESPYGDCTNMKMLNDVFPELKISRKYQYSKKGCHAACKALYIYNKCQCVPKYLKDFYATSTSGCHTKTKEICMTTYDRLFYYRQNVRVMCNDRCSDACLSITYTMTHSSTVLNTDKIGKKLLQIHNMTPEEAQKNWCVIRMYFSTMNVVTINDVPVYTFWSLASDIGGAFGLLLGSALFTVLEILDFILILACKKVFQKCR